MSEIGSRQFVALRRGTSRICLLSPLSRDERGSGRWCGSRARFENWRDGYASSGRRQPFAYQVHTRWLQSSVPSFHTFLHLRLAISSVSSLADHLLSPFSIPRDVSVSFLPLSLSRPIHPVSLSPLRFSPPSLLAIILRSLRELLHFVSLFHSPHPRPFSLPFQSHQRLRQRPCSNLLPLAFFPPLPLFLLAHSSLLCIRLSPFPALSIAYISYRVEIATRAFHFLPEIPLFPFLSSSRDLHSFRRQSHFIYRARFLHDLFRSFRR